MIAIDYKDSRPLYEQIAEKFAVLIRKGILLADDKMPAVRTIAIELSINPNTIQRAYERLEEQGFLYVIKGRGTFVANTESISELWKEEVLSKIRSCVIEAEECGMNDEEIIEFIKKIKRDKE